MYAFTVISNLIAFVQNRLVRDSKGAALVEYALLVALIAAAAIGILYGLGGSIAKLFGSVNTAINSVNVPTA